MVGAADKNQGGDTEGRVHDQIREKTPAGDVADGLVNIVEEIADRPEK